MREALVAELRAAASEDEAVAVLGRVVAHDERCLARLRDVVMPEGAAADYERYLGLVERSIAETRALRRSFTEDAGVEGDEDAATRDTRATALAAELRAAAARCGLRVCGQSAVG